jgi:hypothetical protein
MKKKSCYKFNFNQLPTVPAATFFFRLVAYFRSNVTQFLHINNNINECNKKVDINISILKITEHSQMVL